MRAPDTRQESRSLSQGKPCRYNRPVSTPPVPARVFGFVAAEADVCVLVRSGPGKRTLMIRWDLETDAFEIGQWLLVGFAGGRLSPDGELLAYVVHNSKYASYYSVVSRPPYFTALALWYMAGPYSNGVDWAKNSNEISVSSPDIGYVPTEYQTRLSFEESLPSSWIPAEDGSPRRHRPSPIGELVWYWDPYQPFYSLDDDLLDATWADVDHRGRLLFARAGRVYVRVADGERELIDLNPYEFRPFAPPEWATRWP